MKTNYWLSGFVTCCAMYELMIENYGMFALFAVISITNLWVAAL
jgi:hypothetical protein